MDRYFSQLWHIYRVHTHLPNNRQNQSVIWKKEQKVIREKMYNEHIFVLLHTGTVHDKTSSKLVWKIPTLLHYSRWLQACLKWIITRTSTSLAKPESRIWKRVKSSVNTLMDTVIVVVVIHIELKYSIKQIWNVSILTCSENI